MCIVFLGGPLWRALSARGTGWLLSTLTPQVEKPLKSWVQAPVLLKRYQCFDQPLSDTSSDF